MKTSFAIRNGQVVAEETSESAAVRVYSAPDEAEKQDILANLRIDAYDLESALDPDEISRMEFAPERLAVIWKRPKPASFEQQVRLDVSSVGLFLQGPTLTVVTLDLAPSFGSKEFLGVNSSVDVMLRFLLHTVRHYLGHLKAIKQLTLELEQKVSTSMENRYLLQMFTLGESLIYYLNAIEANGAVLAKLLASAEKIGLSKQQAESLSDIHLDNQQCGRQAQIYSTVLSGLMDARGTMINNNMNVLLRNLTLINVVFLPLNLLASIGGMSEFSAMTAGIDWRVAYFLFSLAMVLLGWLTWVLLIRNIDPTRRSRGRA